jgi:hypothetical protein
VKTAFTQAALKSAVFYFTLAIASQTAYTQESIKFRLLRETVVVVPAKVNGAGPFDFVLDTGTTTTLLDSDLARRLSLSALDRIQLHSVDGTQTAVRTSLSSLALASGSVKNIEALVVDLREAKTVDSRIAGVLGQNFLSRFNYLLDYRRRSLTLETANEIRERVSGEVIPLQIRDQKILVQAETQPGGQEKLLLWLDSAANQMVLFHRASAAMNLRKQSSMSQLTTASSISTIDTGRLPFLKIGLQIFRDLAVSLPPPAATDAQRSEDGLLPTTLFHSLYVNNGESFAIFNPRVNGSRSVVCKRGTPSALSASTCAVLGAACSSRYPAVPPRRGA